ncbi:MAG: O-antigen ligase family protein [Patescibacteria group bacterium]
MAKGLIVHHGRYWAVAGVALLAVIVMGIGSSALPWFFVVAGLLFLVLCALIIRDPATGIVLIALALPFERIGAYEFGDMTIRISQIFLAVTTAAWAVYAAQKKQFHFAKNPALIPLGIFLAVNVFSLMNAVNLGRSLTILGYIVFTAMLAFVIPNLVLTERNMRRILAALLIAFVAVSIFGLFQFLGDMTGLPPEVTGLRDLYSKDILGFTRVQSTAYEPLYFANYLLIPVSVLFAFFLVGTNVVRVGWLIALFGLGAVNLVLTVSRGGYLAMAAALFVVSIFFFKKLFTPRNVIILVAAIALVGWIVVQTLSSSGELFTIEKFEAHVVNAFYGASYDERIVTFEQAYAAWRGHPVIGIGPGSFGPYAAPHPYYVPKDGWRIVNNEFIEVLAENGILGFTAFLALIAVLIVRSVRAVRLTPNTYLRALMVGLVAAFIGTIVQYQTFSTLYIVHVWFLIGLMVTCQNLIFRFHGTAGTQLDS